MANNQKICNLATRRRSGPPFIGFLRGIYAASDAPRSPVRALTEQQLLESRARTGHHHVHMVSKQQQQQKKNAHFYEMVSLKVEIITIAQALATRCPPMFVPANEETHFSKISELFSTPFEEKKNKPGALRITVKTVSSGLREEVHGDCLHGKGDAVSLFFLGTLTNTLLFIV